MPPNGSIGQVDDRADDRVARSGIRPPARAPPRGTSSSAASSGAFIAASCAREASSGWASSRSLRRMARGSRTSSGSRRPDAEADLRGRHGDGGLQRIGLGGGGEHSFLKPGERSQPRSSEDGVPAAEPVIERADRCPALGGDRRHRSGPGAVPEDEGAGGVEDAVGVVLSRRAIVLVRSLLWNGYPTSRNRTQINASPDAVWTALASVLRSQIDDRAQAGAPGLGLDARRSARGPSRSVAGGRRRSRFRSDSGGRGQPARTAGTAPVLALCPDLRLEPADGGCTLTGQTWPSSRAWPTPATERSSSERAATASRFADCLAAWPVGPGPCEPSGSARPKRGA